MWLRVVATVDATELDLGAKVSTRISAEAKGRWPTWPSSMDAQAFEDGNHARQYGDAAVPGTIRNMLPRSSLTAAPGARSPFGTAGRDQ